MSVPTYMIIAYNHDDRMDCALPCFRDSEHAKMRADNLLKWDAQTKFVEVYTCDDEGRLKDPQWPLYRSRIPF